MFYSKVYSQNVTTSSFYRFTYKTLAEKYTYMKNLIHFTIGKTSPTICD